jgi:hypothetical protein
MNCVITLKGFANREPPSGLIKDLVFVTQGSRYARTAGLKLANAFGVNSNCITTDVTLLVSQ